MREEDLPRPSSPYGVTKLAGENLCYLYYPNYSLPIISLRYFTVYGPGQRLDMARHQFGKKILLGREMKVYGDGRQSRDFTYIDDVVLANLLAARSNAFKEILNIGGGSRVLLKDAMMEEIIGQKAFIVNRFVPKGDIRHTAAKRRKKLLLSLGFCHESL